MNAIAAISAALLRGEVLTIKTSFKDFGITNLPREASRGVEKKFGVKLHRERKEGKSRYRLPITWFEYRLIIENNPSQSIDKMREYCETHGALKTTTISDYSKKLIPSQQQNLF